jgi:hypothetical protein
MMHDLHTDDLCYRLIDSTRFPAKILAVQPNNRYRVLFLDDGGVEDGVEGEELIPMEGGEGSSVEEGKEGRGEAKDGGDMDEIDDIEKWKRIAKNEMVGKKVIRTAQPGDEIPELTKKAAQDRKPQHLSVDEDDTTSSAADDDTYYDPQGNSQFFAKGDAPPKVTIHATPTNRGGGESKDDEGFVDDGLRTSADDDQGGITAFTSQGDQPLPRGGGLRALRALRK